MERQHLMHVEEIIPLNKQRCKVSLEGGFVFPLYNSERKRFGIEQGNVLTQEAFLEITQKILPERAKARACYLLQAKDYTEAETQRKLREGCYPEETIQQVIGILKEYHYIDDISYADHYIQSKREKQSAKKIYCTLLQKGISADILCPLFEKNPCEEERQIRKWLEKKHFDPEKLEGKERQKAMMALARKGFSWEIIQSILRQ